MTLAERLLGTAIPPRLRPVLLVTAFSVVGQWMLTAYLPIYAVTRLSIPTATAGLMLAAATGTGLVTGPLGGRLVDRMGHTTVLVGGTALQSASALTLLSCPEEAGAFLVAAVMLALAFTLRTTAQNTVVADLALDHERDTAFALLRTAVNVSAAIGPALGATLVLAGWPFVWLAALLSTAGPPTTWLAVAAAGTVGGLLFRFAARNRTARASSGWPGLGAS